jgi:hypothetical protein
MQAEAGHTDAEIKAMRKGESLQQQQTVAESARKDMQRCISSDVGQQEVAMA